VPLPVTGRALVVAGRREDDLAVGQVARIIVVDVGVFGRGDLAQGLGRQVQFEDVEAILLPIVVSSRRSASQCRSISPTNTGSVGR